MKLQEYTRAHNIEESVADKVAKEFKAMTLVDMEKYSEEIQKKCKRRIEELTISKVIDDFFYEARDCEGQIREIVCNYGDVPNYINTYRFGKQFILRREGNIVKGCFYRAT